MVPGEPVEPLARGLEQTARVVEVSDDGALPHFRTLVPGPELLGTYPPAGPDDPPFVGPLLPWIAALASLALRPSAHLEALASGEAAALGLPAHYLGVHIRRGHKWVETAARPLHEYLVALSRCARASRAAGALRRKSRSHPRPRF